MMMIQQTTESFPEKKGCINASAAVILRFGVMTKQFSIKSQKLGWFGPINSYL